MWIIRFQQSTCPGLQRADQIIGLQMWATGGSYSQHRATHQWPITAELCLPLRHSDPAAVMCPAHGYSLICCVSLGVEQEPRVEPSPDAGDRFQGPWRSSWPLLVTAAQSRVTQMSCVCVCTLTWSSSPDRQPSHTHAHFVTSDPAGLQRLNILFFLWFFFYS